MFNEFCTAFHITEKTKVNQAIAFMWFHLHNTGEQEIDISTINKYFDKASLPKFNTTRIRASFAKNPHIYRGNKRDTYRLARQIIEEYDKEFGYIFELEPKIADIARINNTPYLSEQDIEKAQRMAELYSIIHCYENSARKLIEHILSSKLGSNWWEIAANSNMKSKLASRKKVEGKNKWLTPRGSSPLFYLDWGDLLNLMRKYEDYFVPVIKDLKFVELRFEELERVRNIVAHNGVLPSDEDFQRVILSFNDWCRQVQA